MAHSTQRFSCAALVSAALATPGAAFVAAPGGSAPALRTAGRAPQTPAEQQEPGRAAVGATAGSATAACALAAAGAAALARRRRVTSARVLDRPIQVIEWQVDPKLPVPGSEKALATMVGADVETGGEPWDPLGFSKLFDRNFDFNMVMTYPHVQWLREAEIKHGRVCMLAFVGMIVQQFVQIPGYPAEPDWTKTLAACYSEKIPAIGVVQISVFTMLVEGRWYPDGAWVGQMDREPGDLGFDPLKFTKKPGFDLKSMQLKELKNGRLAMIGVASLAANHAIAGSVPALTGLYAARPDAATGGRPATLCGKTTTAARPVAEVPGKTAARYTTQVILPSLTWIKSGLKAGDLAPTELRAKNLGGVDVLIGKDEGGRLFCVGNLCPHIGTPMSEGADVIGDVIVCPLHGSSFKTTTGELIDWCPTPPIIGPLTGLVIEKKNLAVFDVRSSFLGGDIEILVDTNAKRAYEADYWKGILDAQGKDDGTYY